MENPQQEEPVDPKRRLNFQYNGSDLYDSFELRQMAYQLNKAMLMQTSNASSSSYHEMKKKQKNQLNKAFQSPNASSSSPTSYIFHLNSPLYQRQLNFLYRESTRSSRGISGPQVSADKGACRRGTREGGFLTRFWVKVKKGLFG